jgi:hypothetical protein
MKKHLVAFRKPQQCIEEAAVNTRRYFRRQLIAWLLHHKLLMPLLSVTLAIWMFRSLVDLVNGGSSLAFTAWLIGLALTIMSTWQSASLFISSGVESVFRDRTDA